MEEFFIGAFLGALMVFVVIEAADPRKSGMISVASGEYSCELEERVDKTTKWVCERVK